MEETGYRGRGEAKCKPRLEGDHGDGGGGGGCEVATEWPMRIGDVIDVRDVHNDAHR